MSALPQLCVNGLIAASTIALVAFGFGIIYSTTRFFHFAHGIVFTAGAYTALVARGSGLPWLVCFSLAVLASSAMACLMDLWIYRPLRRRHSSYLVFLLASFGIYILLQNLISIAFGDAAKAIGSGKVVEGIGLLGARITHVQIVIVVASVVLLLTTTLLMRATRFGKSVRAVASNPELARISGVDSNRVILLVFAYGSGLAGIAGILSGLNADITPTMGMNALMLGVVAVIVGGTGSIPGIALASLLLGMAQNLGVWKISTKWQDVIVFVILLAFLIFRPQGFMGKRIRKATV